MPWTKRESDTTRVVKGWDIEIAVNPRAVFSGPTSHKEEYPPAKEIADNLQSKPKGKR